MRAVVEPDAGVDSGEITSIDWLVGLIELGLRPGDPGDQTAALTGWGWPVPGCPLPVLQRQPMPATPNFPRAG